MTVWESGLHRARVANEDRKHPMHPLMDRRTDCRTELEAGRTISARSSSQI